MRHKRDLRSYLTMFHVIYWECRCGLKFASWNEYNAHMKEINKLRELNGITKKDIIKNVS